LLQSLSFLFILVELNFLQFNLAATEVTNFWCKNQYHFVQLFQVSSLAYH